jgi:hypothetical protein
MVWLGPKDGTVCQCCWSPIPAVDQHPDDYCKRCRGCAANGAQFLSDQAILDEHEDPVITPADTMINEIFQLIQDSLDAEVGQIQVGDGR